MAVIAGDFDFWLSSKLQELKTDEGVFGSYIKGILEGDETEDEKTEALEGILAGITEDNIGKHVSEILEAWAKWVKAEEKTVDTEPKEDVDVRLVRMLESQSLPTTSHRSNYTEEEKRIREAILAQYSQMSDQEESEEGDEDGGGGCGGGSGGCGSGGGDSGLEKNMNAAVIVQAEREKRERAKLESQKKKEKDKEDREKQKQLKEEKKEKRKTQKGERRR